MTRQHWSDGIAIDADTGFPRWQGETLDLDLAIETLPGDLATVPSEVN